MSRNRLLLMVCLAAAMAPFTACATTLSSEPIRGQVLEEGTNKPIPGAIVIVLWKGTIGTIGHGRTVCYHVETATTDDQGRYQTPVWRKPSPYGDIANRHWLSMAYKSGYEAVPHRYKSTVHLRAFSGGREERLDYMRRIEQSARLCRSPETGEKNLLPLYRALYKEASGYAQTKDGRVTADDFFSGIEIIELGYHEGLKRAIEREEERRQQP